MFGRPTDVTIGGSRPSSPASRTSWRRTSRRSAPGYNFGETDRAVRAHLRGRRRPAAPGGTATSAGRRRWRAGLIAAAARAGCRCSTRATRSRRRPSSLHELVARKNFGVRTLQAEDEIAAAGAALGASFGGSARRHRDVRPGPRPEAETIGLAVMPRAAADDRRRPAGRPVDRHCRPRPSRPTCCRRMFGRHGESPLPSWPRPRRPTASTRRSRPRASPSRYRSPVILLSDTFLANSPSRGRCPTSTTLPTIEPRSPTGRTTTRVHARTCATPTRSRGRGRCRARRASSTASAVWRRRTSPATSPTTPANHERMTLCARRRSTASPTTSRRSRSTTATATRTAGARLGLDVRADPGGGRAGRGRGHEGRARRTCAT